MLALLTVAIVTVVMVGCLAVLPTTGGRRLAHRRRHGRLRVAGAFHAAVALRGRRHRHRPHPPSAVLVLVAGYVVNFLFPSVLQRNPRLVTLVLGDRWLERPTASAWPA